MGGGTVRADGPRANGIRRILLAFRPLAIIIIALVALWMFLSYVGRPYLVFSEKRDDWHARCDAYATTLLSDPAAKACNDERLALAAEAHQHNWTFP